MQVSEKTKEVELCQWCSDGEEPYWKLKEECYYPWRFLCYKCGFTLFGQVGSDEFLKLYEKKSIEKHP